MEVKLQESELISKMVKVLSNDEKDGGDGWGISSVEWVNLYKCWFTAGYEYLALCKNKDKKQGLVFKDTQGNFQFGMVIEYHKGENEEVGGNWTFECTFNPTDMEGAELHYNSDTQYLVILNDTCFKCMKDENTENAGFTMEPEDALTIVEALMRYLKMYLDTNAKDGEVLDLVLDDYFKASVAIEDGIKVMSVVPCGHAKSKIKNDDIVAEEEKTA